MHLHQEFSESGKRQQDWRLRSAHKAEISCVFEQLPCAWP